MTRGRMALLPLAAIVMAATAQPAMPQTEAEMRSVTVRPGGFHEDCLDLREGQAIAYAFSSAEALDFNIHYRVGNHILFLAEEAAVAKAEGRATARVDHNYCVMWENGTNAPVELRYSFGLAGSDRRLRPVRVPAAAPGPERP